MSSAKPSSINDAIIAEFNIRVEKRLADDRLKTATAVRKRGAHPRHHGLVRATFQVRDDVPQDLRYGIFATAGASFAAYVRFSNSGGGASDAERDAHGMAIKLLKVPAQAILEEEPHTQDFILVDAPNFVARSPEDFQHFMVMSREMGMALKDFGPQSQQFADKRKALGEKFPKAADLQSLIRNPVTVEYFSQVPYALGERLTVKYKARPRVFDETEPSPPPADPFYLRTALRNTLATGQPAVVFDFMVQRGQPHMQLDDPTEIWSEADSPFVAVATITINAQVFESPAQEKFAEDISFNPWHALPDHRPLGRMNAARRDVYERMQETRHAANRVVHQEPTGNEF